MYIASVTPYSTAIFIFMKNWIKNKALGLEFLNFVMWGHLSSLGQKSITGPKYVLVDYILIIQLTNECN